MLPIIGHLLQVLQVFGRALETTYAAAGRPYGDTSGGMLRWLREHLPPAE